MKYGAQLYSLRKYLKDREGYERVFSAVKEMGAQVVQVSRADEADAVMLKALVEKYALPICVTHVGFGNLLENTDELAKKHLLFGCRSIGIGMMPPEFRKKGLEGAKRFADKLNGISASLKRFDMTVAYHNHWFEFAEENGVRIFDYMLDNTALEVKFIPDTFWIRVGGGDVFEYLEKLSGRVETLHLKDYSKIAFMPVFRALGKGAFDFAAIIKTAERCGVRNCVAELDFSPKPMKSMNYSLHYLKTITENFNSI
jgi:sugar phosphate isomerase/epimerase